MLDNKTFTSADIIQHEGAFHSLYHHSSFSGLDENTFRQNINQKREQDSADLKDTDLLLVTFGTAYVYRHKQRNHIVANCHKLPANDFDHYRLSVEEIVSIWTKLIDRSIRVNNNLNILFTVSPIRHWKDGAHNNQLSKATLLLAIDELAKLYPNVFYFASYEILMDELRDYRFYAHDMIHPSEVAVEYIWEQFSESLFNENTRRIVKQWLGIRQALLHRPLVDVKNEQYRVFLRQTLLKLDVFSKNILTLTAKMSLTYLRKNSHKLLINNATENEIYDIRIG